MANEVSVDNNKINVVVSATTTADINERFELMEDLTAMVANNITPSILITGQGGLGKTHTVLQTIKNNGLNDGEFVFFKGYSTARGLYNTLYDNNGKLIIFDDCDSVLEDKVAINILKSALDSYDKRTISWMARMNKNDAYPQQFDFTGNIIFISNKSLDKMDEALLTRSLVADLSMTPDEKVARMAHILDKILPEYTMDIKKDALSFLNKKKNDIDLNIRMLIMVSKIRSTYKDKWERLADFTIKSIK
jgi:hypothetical protein